MSRQLFIHRYSGLGFGQTTGPRRPRSVLAKCRGDGQHWAHRCASPPQTKDTPDA
jgi:hypothetical protein